MSKIKKNKVDYVLRTDQRLVTCVGLGFCLRIANWALNERRLIWIRLLDVRLLNGLGYE